MSFGPSCAHDAMTKDYGSPSLIGPSKFCGRIYALLFSRRCGHNCGKTITRLRIHDKGNAATNETMHLN